MQQDLGIQASGVRQKSRYQPPEQSPKDGLGSNADKMTLQSSEAMPLDPTPESLSAWGDAGKWERSCIANDEFRVVGDPSDEIPFDEVGANVRNVTDPFVMGDELTSPAKTDTSFGLL